jgi:capsule polysaccharide export protein KpsE/RkpR
MENTKLNNAVANIHAQLDTFSSMNFEGQKQISELQSDNQNLREEIVSLTHQVHLSRLVSNSLD